MSTVRLTVAQALVRFLASQYSERDGAGAADPGDVRHLRPRQRLRHRPGPPQAAESGDADLPYYQPCNEQSMVHTAIGFARANRLPDAGLHGVDRARLDQHDHRRGRGDDQPPAGAAVALRLLRDPRHQGRCFSSSSTRVSATSASTTASGRCRRFFDRITRPEQILTVGAAGGDARADRPGRDGRGHDRAAAGHPGPCLRLSAPLLPRTASGGCAPARPRARRPDREAVALLAEAQRPVIIAGGGVHLLRGQPELQDFAEALGIPVARPSPARGRWRGIARAPGRRRLEGTGAPAANALAAEADLVLGVGTRLTDFTTGSQSCFQHPEVRFISINVCGRDAYKQGALPIVADARTGLQGAAERDGRLSRRRRLPPRSASTAPGAEDCGPGLPPGHGRLRRRPRSSAR